MLLHNNLRKEESSSSLTQMFTHNADLNSTGSVINCSYPRLHTPRLFQAVYFHCETRKKLFIVRPSSGGTCLREHTLEAHFSILHFTRSWSCISKWILSNLTVSASAKILRSNLLAFPPRSMFISLNGRLLQINTQLLAAFQLEQSVYLITFLSQVSVSCLAAIGISHRMFNMCWKQISV